MKIKRKPLINEELGVFVRGIIIGKVLTLMVIGGLFYWMLKSHLFSAMTVDSSSQKLSNIASPTQSTFRSITSVPPGVFNYGGSAAWAPIRQMVDSQIQGEHPELKLRYVNPTNESPGSGSGIRMLLNGELDFAQSSRPFTPSELTTAQQRGFTLTARQVGIDAIAVVVNPSLSVSSLTIKQLQQIYQGQITNWKLLGGPDLPITPFSQLREDADTVVFSGEKNFALPASSPNLQYINSATEALRLINKTPGGLYYGSARALVPQCMVKALSLSVTSTSAIPPYLEPLVPPQQCPHQRNQINTTAIKNGSYPITSKLYVIIKQNKGKSEQAGDAYTKLLLTNQGQEAIERSGFIGVR
ncbi:MAG: substrate-binding domain-containing protein [Rhizonema sp. NSF051]|nr:substrate-binding domain-containing protein [Rhizonema sp. NSF051]